MIQHQVVEYLLLPDEREPLEKELKRLADQRQVHVIFTTGGTGFSVRDITPEATIAVCDRMANGIADAIRNLFDDDHSPCNVQPCCQRAQGPYPDRQSARQSEGGTGGTGVSAAAPGTWDQCIAGKRERMCEKIVMNY